MCKIVIRLDPNNENTDKINYRKIAIMSSYTFGGIGPIRCAQGTVN